MDEQKQESRFLEVIVIALILFFVIYILFGEDLVPVGEYLWGLLP